MRFIQHFIFIGFIVISVFSLKLSANQNRPAGLPNDAKFNAKYKVWIVRSATAETVFYSDGNKKSQGGIDQNLRNGHWVFYFANGEKKAEGSYVLGKMEENWKFYYSSGKLESEGDYKNNSKTGQWTIYFASGQKKSEGEYTGGLKSGTWIEYYESGKVFYKGQFVAGMAHGTWSYNFEDGSFYQAGRYSEDVKVGAWKICIAPGGPCGEQNHEQDKPPKVSGLPKESGLQNSDPYSILDNAAPDEQPSSWDKY
ncbi:MAG: toxin-antitoxin system YwqK family antitoxin [Leptonema sp. (in: Bacteria)]|nr:toxin-antitoxin system YwqK family antitoxin [Leptonema sp. (in: bacteria)]